MGVFAIVVCVPSNQSNFFFLVRAFLVDFFWDGLQHDIAGGGTHTFDLKGSVVLFFY
jgi:hypothetical protein